MIVSPLPENERERLEFLRKYQILDTEFEKDFDGIIELASEVCDAPIAMINLVDENRQWSKALKGIDSQNASRDHSFCSHTILGNDMMLVPDALKDKRFSDNPYVLDDPKIRFYAGMPLIVDSGHKLGALCVIDRVPRVLSEKQLNYLKILAKQVINLLNLRLSNLRLQNLVRNKTFELSNLFDRIGDAFISLDKNWNYTYANNQVGELINRSPADLIGKNVWKEFPQAINSSTYHAFHRAMKEQKYTCHTDYYEPLNLWLENHIYPTSDGISVFIRDISERKLAERRLVESIESLERAEEQAKMGSWQLDITTGKSVWSKQLSLLFGFEPGEVPPFEKVLERVHPEDKSILITSVERMKQGIDPGETIIRTNPLVIPLHYLLGYTRNIKDDRGETIRFEGIMIDVTELHKTNNELDHFVYSISHDLRAPLASILGLLNVAEMETPESTVAHHLKQIRNQVNRLDNVIKEILDYSMNARTDTCQEEIEFGTLVEKIKSNLNFPDLSNRIQVTLEIEGATEFYSDRSRLEIILTNLYSNSINYQDLKKESCAIQIKINIDEHQASIIYTDNGIGIEKIHLSKIFDMFYRATENAKGPGLGLYIVKEAIYKLGGKIQVTSEFGKGTTFEMLIPNYINWTVAEEIISSK